MILVDDGRLRLTDPVDELLPELAGRRVLRSLDAELDDTVPAIRSITLEDLLTFRLGFGLVMAPPGRYPIQVAVERLVLRTLGPPWPPTPYTPDEWMHHFGTLPLIHQPGEQWMYNTSAQVLGVLLQRATGQPLPDVLGERVFAPLGMTDTAFSVPPAKLGRFTTAYSPGPAQVSSPCSTVPRAATGARRRRSPMPPGGWCPRSMTSGRSPSSWSTAARTRAAASSRRRRSG
jgi:CubicO group peptidase (beta-lactamase class C family)